MLVFLPCLPSDTDTPGCHRCTLLRVVCTHHSQECIHLKLRCTHPKVCPHSMEHRCTQVSSSPDLRCLEWTGMESLCMARCQASQQTHNSSLGSFHRKHSLNRLNLGRFPNKPRGKLHLFNSLKLEHKLHSQCSLYSQLVNHSSSLANQCSSLANQCSSLASLYHNLQPKLLKQRI